jgi:hypothetical protein
MDVSGKGWRAVRSWMAPPSWRRSIRQGCADPQLPDEAMRRRMIAHVDALPTA